MRPVYKSTHFVALKGNALCLSNRRIANGIIFLACSQLDANDAQSGEASGGVCVLSESNRRHLEKLQQSLRREFRETIKKACLINAIDCAFCSVFFFNKSIRDMFLPQTVHQIDRAQAITWF